MEIGAVKQSFNNELILLKKSLNQAKTQIIHKLTRRAKQLMEKKTPDTLKDKMKRKAESAIREVLIIKKIKARDIGKFAITHKGKLEEYLNKPQVDNDKACARLLLHKALQDKYKFLRNRFSNIPIKDLFMSRQERKKLKKEEQQKKNEKQKKNKVVHAEGDWDVEDVNTGDQKIGNHIKKLGDDDEMSAEEQDQPQPPSDVDFDNNEQDSSDEGINAPSDAEDVSEDGATSGDDDGLQNDDESDQDDNSNAIESDDEESEAEPEDLGKITKIASALKGKKPFQQVIKEPKNNKVDKIPNPTRKAESRPDKPAKDTTKNKNLKDKILNKKFKKDTDDLPNPETKVVDPFFITATGENYMSVAEPRQPDEFKEEHRQGNRKLRRAVMFGHVPKIKPRQNYKQQNQNGNFDRQNNKLDRNNRFNNESGFDGRTKDRQNGYQNNKEKFNNNRKFDEHNGRPSERNSRNQEEKPEKLHPSWEAKKKQSGLLPFQGKKIVFSES